MKRILSFLAFCGICLTMASMLAPTSGLNLILLAIAIGAVLIVADQLPKKNEQFLFRNDAIGNGLDTQIWLPRLVKQLFKNNEFLLRSENDSEYVNYLTVNKPQEGAGQPWVKNRDHDANAAGTNTVRRVDTVKSYNIDEWTSEPMKVTRLEDVQLSYPKMDSVLNQLIKVGRQTISNQMIYNWSATKATNIYRTSGIQNNDPSQVYASGLGLVNGTATGTRNVFGLYDMKRAFTHMTKCDVGTDGWVMLMSADRYQELLDDMVISKYRDGSGVFDFKNGVVNRVMNFDIYIRSSVQTYDNSGLVVPKAYGAAEAVDDNDAILFWSESEVCRAVGENEIFYNAGQARHYGDIVSALARAGGSKNRISELGVVAIVQSIGA